MKAKVLIVDDDVDFAVGLQKLLEERDFAPTFETSSSDVRARILKEEFDLFLLDVRMDNYSGLDVLIDIMSHNISHKVIMMSGSSGEADEVLKCFRLGATEYLTKPI